MAGSPSPSHFESLSSKLYAPLIPPLLSVISGILFVRFLSFSPIPALLGAALSLLLWLLARHRHFPWAALIAGNAILFWLAAASSARHFNKPHPQIDAAPREIVLLDGCIDSLPQREPDRFFFIFAASPSARIRTSLYLPPGQSPPSWRYGDRLSLPLRLHPIRNSGNPGSFDAETYFAHRDIYWNATISSGPLPTPAAEPCGHPIQAAIYSLRAALLSRIHSVTSGDRYLSAILGALLLGDNARLEEADTENYRRTGTYHAIVISGIHITVLASALFGLLRLLRFRPLPAYCCCALMAILYALVCDLSSPVVRAAGGYLLFLGARFLYRNGRILNLLAAVAILYLLADPAQLFEASFQLSFLSVLTLATLAIPLLEHSTGPWLKALHHLHDPAFASLRSPNASRRLELLLAASTFSRLFHLPERALQQTLSASLRTLIWAIDLTLTSAVILIGLSLPMILFFHRLTFSSLTANLPVVVLLSLAVPLGFLTLLTGPVLLPLLKWLLFTSRAVVDWHVSWDIGARLPDPPLWVLIALPSLLLATAAILRRAPRWSPLPAAALLALFAYVLLHPYSRQPLLSLGLLELTSIDVGQGDSLFLATPSGHLALLDAGGSRNPKFDPGESLVSNYLWTRHISRLHTLIASHSDLDHMGGLIAAHDNFSPAEIWVSPYATGPLWLKLKAHALARHTRIRYLAQGDTAHLGNLPVRVLWPPRGETFSKSNLTSLVLLLEHETKRFLLTGDIDSSVESRLLEASLLPPIDYLKLAHHGSRSSTAQFFLDQTRPALAVASSGFQNPFNHPHPAVLARLQASHTLLFRTDLQGQVTVLSDGRRLQAHPYLYRLPARLTWVPLFESVE
jgi:competence protein ComEC